MSNSKSNSEYDLSPELPNKQMQQWDSTSISKGVWSDYESTPAYVWAIIGHCKPSACPAYDKCTYCSNGSHPDKCQAQSYYLRAIYRLAVHSVGTRCSPPTMALIGLELIPLYDQLFRLKLHLSNPRRIDPTYTTPNGGKRVDPAMKEMREVIKSIRQLWQHLIDAQSNNKGKRAKDIDPQRLGDQAYIDAMCGGTASASASASASADSDTDTDSDHPDPNADYDSDADADTYEEGTGIDMDAMPEKSTRRRRSNKRRVRKQYWKKPGPKKRRGKNVKPYSVRHKPESESETKSS